MTIVYGATIPRSFSKETALNSAQSLFASSWMRVVEKPSVWHRAIHALVLYERLFRRYVSPDKHVIVNGNKLLCLLFFIVVNDNAQWCDNDVKMNILCCRPSGFLVSRHCRVADNVGSCVASVRNCSVAFCDKYAVYVCLFYYLFTCCTGFQLVVILGVQWK